MKIFSPLIRGLKWLGNKGLWLIRRNETLFAIRLASKMIPIPALDLIVTLVIDIDTQDKSGIEKMADALEALPIILHEFDIEIEEESDMRLLLELAVAIMKNKARVIPRGE